MTEFFRPALTDEQEEMVARYLTGEMPPEERAAFERRCLDDTRLFEAVYGDVALQRHAPIAALPVRFGDAEAAVLPLPVRSGDAAPAPAPVPLRLEPGRTRRRWWAIAIPVAAAIGLILLMRSGMRSRPGRSDLLRGGARTVELLEPRGDVSALPHHFEWKPLAGASSYRVEILDSEFRTIFQTSTSATALDPGAGVIPDSIRSGRWRVVALNAEFAELGSSAYAAFHITGR